mmetsp:Transcript_9891/g.16277  ORF Transcript_9891/g.16277 Transcript_9891/m.16277 type:complete len:81 (+) Transcript_9891:98-340(+)
MDTRRNVLFLKQAMRTLQHIGKEDFDNHLHEEEFLKDADAEYVVEMITAMDIEENGHTKKCLVLEAGDEDLTAYWERGFR